MGAQIGTLALGESASGSGCRGPSAGGTEPISGTAQRYRLKIFVRDQGAIRPGVIAAAALKGLGRGFFVHFL
jgi:hypothetical protein